MTLDEKIGQLFIFGFDGTEPSEELQRFIRHANLGGVVLLKRNIRDPLQLFSLIAALQASSPSLPLFVAVDQEGGRVSRLDPPFTQFPSPARVGEVGSVKLAHAMGAAIGKELRAVGINVDLAPVLDVNTNPSNPVIGDRAFGADPDLVAELGVSFFWGLKEQGILAVGKHFPGHGDTSLDSHEALPIVSHPKERLDAVELQPFAEAIEAGIPALMTAHVLYPSLDPWYPATLSKAILTDLLRGELGFPGLIVSDDLAMKAISDRYGSGEAAVRFLEAGGDLVLICHTWERQMEAIEAVKYAVEEGRISEERIEESLRRIIAVKERYLVPPTSASPEMIAEVVGCEEHQRIAQAIGGYRG
ncbi:MAG: beta-N-acetylhexosaminidase [candidate division NC10 bacterium]|nr:beta-N-acetylhexosaminidase [candidate division NC10 bacterium]